MKIVVLEGSPNKNGSSNLLANEFIRGAQEAGHSCTVIDAAHANLHPCTGCVSGAKTDKSELFDYVVSDAGVPMIADAPVSMECTVDDVHKTPNFESFICKISATWADDSVLTADGKLDYAKLKPVLFEMPTYQYLRTGEVIAPCMSFGKQEQKG